MGYYNRETKKYETCPEEAARMLDWIRNRGGLAIWDSCNLSDPGKTWTTPATTQEGKPASVAGKPHWSCGSVIATITDIADVSVVTPKEVKRFHIAVRMGSQGFTVKLTDGSTRRVRAAREKAARDTGKDAWYEFDYSSQEAVIFVPGDTVPLKDWKPAQTPEPVTT